MPPILTTALTTKLGDQPEDEPGRIGERNSLPATDLAPQDASYRNPRAVLMIGDRSRSRAAVIVDWRNIHLAIDGEDITCTIGTKALDREKIPGAIPKRDDEHFVHILSRLRTNETVRVIVPNGPDGPEILFEGSTLTATIQWSQRSQTLSFTAISRGQEKLRHGEGQQILGRYMRGKAERIDNEPTWEANDPDHRLITALAAVFNAGGRPNRTADAVELKVGQNSEGTAFTKSIHLWTDDDHPDAKYWTYAQAIRTLCVLWVTNAGRPISVFQFMKDSEQFKDADPSGGPDPFERRITQRVGDASIQSMNVEDALIVLLDGAGLHFEIATKTDRVVSSRPLVVKAEHFLRVWAYARNGEEIAAQAERDEKRMIVPAVHDVPRDPPFTDYAGVSAAEIARRNAAQQALITIDSRDAGRTTNLGGYEEVEVSLLLRPGWAPHPQLDDLTTPAARKAAKDFWIDEFSESYLKGRVPGSKFSTLHRDHASVADVFRLWIFPDDATYDELAESLGRDDGPWATERYKTRDPNGKLWFDDPLYGGDLFPGRTEFWIPRRRPIRETIGRQSTSTTDQSPIVRIHFGVRDEDGNPTTEVPTPNDPNWVVYSGPAPVDDHRLALRFTDDNFYDTTPMLQNPDDSYADNENKAVEAYIDRHFWVQVTGTIRGDQRMRSTQAMVTSDLATRVRNKVRDVGFEKFAVRQRRGVLNSFLKHLPTDELRYENRDDEVAFADWAERRAQQTSGATVAGNVELFYLDRRFRNGDVISGVAGLGLAFDRHPMVKSVVYINNGGDQRTEMMLEDMRHNPELEGGGAT